MTGPAPASDGAVLRTATSLVIAAASTYQSLAALPAGGGVPALGVVRDHIADALVALRQARADLSEATRAVGARVAQDLDPGQAAVVAQVLPTVRGPGDVVGLALIVEDVLAQTLVADAVVLSVPTVRALVAGLGAAAAARTARLLLVASLLATGRPELLATPPDLFSLPAAIGTLGSPDARYPTDKAVAAGDGAP